MARRLHFNCISIAKVSSKRTPSLSSCSPDFILQSKHICQHQWAFSKSSLGLPCKTLNSMELHLSSCYQGSLISARSPQRWTWRRLDESNRQALWTAWHAQAREWIGNSKKKDEWVRDLTQGFSPILDLLFTSLYNCNVQSPEGAWGMLDSWTDHNTVITMQEVRLNDQERRPSLGRQP